MSSVVPVAQIPIAIPHVNIRIGCAMMRRFSRSGNGLSGFTAYAYTQG
jgi:hypothetical protein